MTSHALFVGVVSHTNSRFMESQGPHGLAAQLAHRMPGIDLRINTVNLVDSHDPPLTSQVIQKSLSELFRIENAWSRFLDQPQSASARVKRASRWIHRLRQRLYPPPESAFTRLLNIELSHRDLMNAGLVSGNEWILILEDDAFAQDVSDLVSGLQGLMTTGRRTSFVNLSESFSLHELGAHHLVRPSDVRWAGTTPRRIVESPKPITNTVCAILYHRSFLTELAMLLDSLPLVPIVPIDWKLNFALMSLFQSGILVDSANLTVEPSPITQMSMHPPGILGP